MVTEKARPASAYTGPSSRKRLRRGRPILISCCRESCPGGDKPRPYGTLRIRTPKKSLSPRAEGEGHGEGIADTSTYPLSRGRLTRNPLTPRAFAAPPA